MAAVMPSLNNITWERLLREDAVTYPCDAADKPGNEIIFTSSFPTKSGRARIVPADLVSRPTSCRTPIIRWCLPPDACWSIGTPGR
mgnify:CR=1 FL=1